MFSCSPCDRIKECRVIVQVKVKLAIGSLPFSYIYACHKVLLIFAVFCNYMNKVKINYDFSLDSDRIVMRL